MFRCPSIEDDEILLECIVMAALLKTLGMQVGLIRRHPSYTCRDLSECTIDFYGMTMPYYHFLTRSGPVNIMCFTLKIAGEKKEEGPNDKESKVRGEERKLSKDRH